MKFFLGGRAPTGQRQQYKHGQHYNQYFCPKNLKIRALLYLRHKKHAIFICFFKNFKLPEIKELVDFQDFVTVR